MTRTIGTSAYGLRAPIVKQGDDLVKIVVDTVLNSGLNIEDKDVLGVTESIVARCEGNYVTIDEVAEEIKKISKEANVIDVIDPVYSRNRFAMILKAIARAAGKKVRINVRNVDEVGNVLRDHPFTKINYDEYYKSIVEAEGKECEVINWDDNYEGEFNAPDYTIDARMYRTTKDIEYDLNFICGLQHICSSKCFWGLHGSNKSSEELLKLFPSKDYAQKFVDTVQEKIKEITGKEICVMCYGDGGFKCPVSGIWECLDPVISPAYTSNLEGTPNEIKIKNFADEKYKDLKGKELEDAIKKEIESKNNDLKGSMTSQGTTPRQYTDLLGSLMDLTSGSGDKGTPFVYVKGYFDNMAND